MPPPGNLRMQQMNVPPANRQRCLEQIAGNRDEATLTALYTSGLWEEVLRPKRTTPPDI
jgi:hypothetical protein